MEADHLTLGAAGAAAGAMIGAIVSGAVTLGGAWMLWRRVSHRIRQESETLGHRIRQESDVAALTHYEGVIGHLNREIERKDRESERQQQQIDRQDLHIGELADGLDQCRQEHGSAQRQIDELYGWAERSHENARRLARKARLDPDAEVVPPPARAAERTRASGSVEARARTLLQNTQQVQELSKPQPPPAPEKG